MSVFRHGAWRGVTVAACLLTGCAAPAPTPWVPSASRIAVATPGAAPSAAGAGLQPLARDLSVPPGAPPRSAVAAVNYDLSVSSIDDAYPDDDDDGVPGDDEPREIFQRGGASWYGIQFHQRKTANGERFDMSAFTAAHRTLPFGTAVCVRSLVNGREVLVRINDRGPFSAGRIIDLSRAAAVAIDMIGLGIKQVALTVVRDQRVRCGGVPVDQPVPAPSGLGFRWK